ncbi:Ser/Thr protein phosphatase family protein [Paecilomyces variotii No. 5]|uniref:Ser/Thr protein phosphatase family protein n=1 Tax=Byssochlamys spectabilis (strain No. 5 / NBRC 109023) TaxID=1356009 RepID=V5F9F5_BYSSN|nr:Ser/Thr protein phosphatase family protein [Paecilomyces variotii No. 5]
MNTIPDTPALIKGIKTRICMISDTHTYPPSPPQQTGNPYRYPLPTADVLLHAGDITMVGRKAEHRKMIDMLKEADAEVKIVIAGNHDITLDDEYYQEFGYTRHRWGGSGGGTDGVEDPAEIKQMYTGEEARNAGIVYLEEGLKTFKLKNGAQFTLYASPYQPEFCRWAFAYERDVDRFNPSSPVAKFQAPNPVPDFPGVDIMLTHGPPYGVLDKVVYGDQHVGCEHLLRADMRARPRLHVFGHIHEGYGAELVDWETRISRRLEQDIEDVLDQRCAHFDFSSSSKEPLRVGDETLFVNASVVTVNYKAINAPWLVDLDLEPATEDVTPDVEV